MWKENNLYFPLNLQKLKNWLSCRIASTMVPTYHEEAVYLITVLCSSTNIDEASFSDICRQNEEYDPIYFYWVNGEKYDGWCYVFWLNWQGNNIWEQPFIILDCISLFNHTLFAKGTEDSSDKTCDY